MREAIGMIETTSIAIGQLVQDAMLKSANVTIVLARTICSGKYINVVTGSVADVESAIQSGVGAASDGIIDHIVIPNIHPTVFPALGGSVTLESPTPGALGIIETFSASSVLQAADAAAKAASITLFRVHLAMAVGGKGYLNMCGTVADVTAGVDAGAAVVREKGLLVAAVTIPGPRQELLQDYI